jgi:hypothetical protein
VDTNSLLSSRQGFRRDYEDESKRTETMEVKLEGRPHHKTITKTEYSYLEEEPKLLRAHPIPSPT